MKKFLCTLVCMMLLVPSALAETAPRKLSSDELLYTSLYERSMELAWLFNEALHSESYIALFTVNNFEETVRLLQMQDFTQPWDVAIVRADRALSDAGLGPIAEALPEADLSMALEEMVWQKAYHATGNYLTAAQGVETLALSSVLTFSDAYICPEKMDGPCFVLMQYGGLYAFLVTFYPTVNGTMTVQARFIPSRAVDALNLPAE
ncbi:MAG: hypothetical protein IJ189_09395 [Clostridia bacterium]|nr:hypothetical protein [Clostridia bacterium]